jgi:uncharacterized membrane protein YfcA
MKSLIIILAGLASGVVSGMGIGGGAILIPVLGMVGSIDQKVAQSVNLLYFIPTALGAVILHIKNKNIHLKPLIPMILFGIAGAVVGSLTALHMQSTVLKKMFGIFLFLLAVREFWMLRPKH